MKRALAILALAALAGCGDNIHNGPPPVTPGKVGSGALNATFNETVSLATGTVFSAAHYTGSMDTIGIAFRIASGTASCTEVVEYSNDYSASIDAPTDDTKWDTYTLTTSPPAIAGGAQKFGVQLDFWEFQYERVKFTCASGTTTLTLVSQLKGG